MTWTTHTVFNQPQPLSNSNLFLSDTPLREALAREGAEWDREWLASVGAQLGGAACASTRCVFTPPGIC